MKCFLARNSVARLRRHSLPSSPAATPLRIRFRAAEKGVSCPSPPGAMRRSPKTTVQQAVRSVGVEHLNSLERDMEVIELDVEYVDDSAYPTTA